MKRWHMFGMLKDGDIVAEAILQPDGPWVKYEDVKHLQDELDSCRDLLCRILLATSDAGPSSTRIQAEGKDIFFMLSDTLRAEIEKKIKND